MTGARSENGFTLIEAMVAMVILAIAAAGIIRASEAHVDTIHALEQRTAARWVAENALAEASLGIAGPDQQAMLNWNWTARTAFSPSDDPDMRQVSVAVREAGSASPLVSLRGFADARTTSK